MSEMAAETAAETDVKAGEDTIPSTNSQTVSSEEAMNEVPNNDDSEGVASGDGLFGDESDRSGDESDNSSDSDENSSRRVSSRPTGLGMSDDDEEQQMYNRKFYGDDLTGPSDRSDEEEAEIREADVEVVKHVVPYYTTSKNKEDTLYYAKIPQFLTIDPVPFDPLSFKAQVKQRQEQYSSKEDQLDDRLIDENTVRWRYSRGENQQVFKDSNAQVIQWSDGTFSLKLGDEYNDILVNDIENTFMTVSHDQQELMQCVEGGEIKHSMLFIPTSTNSSVHQRLSKAVARREARESGPSTYIVRMDPELEKKELEKKHDQLIRERRKRQLREQMDRENAELEGVDTGSFGIKRTAGRLQTPETYGRRFADEYDDEDGFIDDAEEVEGYSDESADGAEALDDGNSDEEEDLNAERLKRLKKEGAAMYKETRASSQDSDGADQGSIQKRRKIAVLDSDEE
ncbi:HGL308Cp [Eremothecium sinecaudum]|uniref:HGL308Cp n=1 Tax=Eremothecium sinecaudum TaxID=45286 RepID=A0A0X8HV51_9SACH|nr:HGL308Cp [Eremothecium sinecaudum]AMD22032.1 HGL308Cp [Eremothecium sinecaudum]